MDRYTQMARALLAAVLLGTCIDAANVPAKAHLSSAHVPDTVSDVQAIEQVVMQAETAELTLPYPELGAVARDATSVQSATARVALILNTLYAPSSPRLSDRLARVQHALQAEREGGIRMLSAGISNVAFTSVAISGSTATASLTFTAHADFTSTAPDGTILRYTPANNMIGSLSLIETATGWRIMNEVNAFAPGSEP